jgi:flagellar hook-associated protein 1
MSTFHGLEMAKRALYTQQSALYTTGHNISNANTEGYSRQRVNFETLPAYPTGSRNRPQIPGQLGQGVQAGSVERIRDSFLDLQYRAENSKAGYWETMSESLYRMESLLNEPSDSGLANTMDKFWQSLQDLAVNPENTGARSVVVQRGLAVADTFNYLTSNLKSMQKDIGKQVEVTVKDANSLIRQIDRINNQIKELEPHGYLPNDLYDERDRLVDELSGIVNIKVHRVESADSALDIAGGLTRIELVDDNGALITNLVDPESDGATYQEFSFQETGSDITVEIDGGDFKVSSNSGSLSSLLEVYGNGATTDEQKVNFKDMIANIEKMAETFVEEFNNIHNEGFTLYGEKPEVDFKFFSIDDVTKEVSVSKTVIDDNGLIAASGNGNSGNGENALKLADVMDKELAGNPFENGATIKSFYEGVIGGLGVATQESNRMANNTSVLRSQVQEQRMSVSSVSLDEEMTNMIKFQHAYNAAARNMTAVDEILDRIINNMGIVGR